MDWVRGEKLGHGSFATVNLAKPRNLNPQFPPLMAVKYCGVLHSSSLVKEKSILDELKDCPEIIRCFGESFSVENGEKLYNLLLEYASGGDLAEKVKNSGDLRLPESEVRRYTKSLLKGLQYIHRLGYVHCDIKLQNILLGPDGTVKIADFGLAKRIGSKKGCISGFELRGTPLYMSPEMVISAEQEPATDVWALGCAVSEMVAGSPAWRHAGDDVAALLMRIGVGDEVPEIPGELSEEGKDFLRKCFVKDPRKRWTAEMLLDHPFVSDDVDSKEGREKNNLATTSPRCPFDWVSSVTCSITSLPSPEYSTEPSSWFAGESNLKSGSCSERLRGLSVDRTPDWSVSDGWVNIR